jgi:threonine dehydratase
MARWFFSEIQHMSPIDFDDVARAAERIRAIAHRTPVMTSRMFDERAGCRAVFKCENLQRTGAFKIRGAANFVFSIPASEAPRGVVTFSSGNHAQAVAIAAATVGAPATIVMPQDSPRSKMEATRVYGARVVTYDRMTENREAIGARIAAETRATLVPPFDHPWTMAGQGTAALEVLEQAPDIDALVVPIGGGGLISGCAVAAKAIKPGIRVFGVEPENANDTFLSMRAGERVAIPIPNTSADGLRATQPGELTFQVIRQYVEQVLLVSEEEIRAAMAFLLTRMKIVVEPSGAVSAAAVLFRKVPADVQRPGIVLSGGNVDLDFLKGL